MHCLDLYLPEMRPWLRISVRRVSYSSGRLACQVHPPHSSLIYMSDLVKLPEWAHNRASIIPSGWSGRGGQATSPYYPLGDASGSSTGSGTGTAIGLAAAALGTETDGSIISPSSRSNIVGIKPTVGLTSRAGGRLVYTLSYGLLRSTDPIHSDTNHAPSRHRWAYGSVRRGCGYPPY